ncbi:MAG: endolytic transglycosylase MltG [Minisyncoccia bacterium]
MRDRISKLFFIIVLVGVISGSALFAILSIVTLQAKHEQVLSNEPDQFPVTVDPKNRLIVENAQVNASFENPSSPFQAAVGNVGNILWSAFEWIATTLTDASWYQSVAAVAGAPRLVTITPGMRKEQVASTFAKTLGWNKNMKYAFMTATTSAQAPSSEGSFSPGTYSVTMGMTPKEVRSLVEERFMNDILSHYGTTTASIVPLHDALIIASLIQRETIGTSDMRLVSGVIWNRLFLNMKLQLDATLQYAKADEKSVTSWWPKVVPADTRRRSAYNTYIHEGLPPTPIANPSVAAVLAALNPISTPCLFYFNDTKGNILCTNTYKEHVALLKKYYGRGK